MNIGDIVIGLMIVVLLIMIGLLGFFVFDGITGYSCGQTSVAMGVGHQYGFAKGCLINVNGAWIPIDNYIINKEK